jgi:hypothetical protein
VSGIDFFEFPVRSRGKVESGTGWFTTGDVDRCDFSISSKVHLKRVKRGERSILAHGGRKEGSL